MATIKDLCKKFPRRVVVKAKIWTLDRNTIESIGSHDPLNGELISLLLIHDLQSENERCAAQALIDMISKKNANSD